MLVVAVKGLARDEMLLFPMWLGSRLSYQSANKGRKSPNGCGQCCKVKGRVGEERGPEAEVNSAPTIEESVREGLEGSSIVGAEFTSAFRITHHPSPITHHPIPLHERRLPF